MKSSFREKHLLNIFSEYEQASIPIDKLLKQYFKSHHSLGSKDRKEIQNKIYTYIRHKILIEYLLKDDLSWEKKLSFLDNFDPSNYENDENIPTNIKVSFPEYIFNILKNDYEKEKAYETCKILNSQAPTTIRTNLLKTDTNILFEKLKNHYDVKRCSHSKDGITFNKRINFNDISEYKEGHFEVQDEASQLISELIKAKPEQNVLDYCAGAGGKSLAIASNTQDKALIHLYDVRKDILHQAKKRLLKANVKNFKILYKEDASLENTMDWIIVDVPCSGSGTWRRNSDLKWNFTEKTLNSLVEEQREIFKNAIKYLKKNGKILYSTCSIFSAENEKQIEYFINTHKMKPLLPFFKSLPKNNEMDGFFGSILEFENSSYLG